MGEEALERYRQRYETWRHLDGVRYNLLHISLTGTAALVAFLDLNKNLWPTWVWLGFALFLIGQSFVLSKVNDAIVKNGEALSRFALEIGDKHIPSVADRTKSVFYYLEWTLRLVGVLFIIVWLVALIG